MEHDPHTGFIIAAFVISAAVIGAMIAVIIVDARTLRQKLTRFGVRGADRR